jgi:glutathione S-transferase
MERAPMDLYFSPLACSMATRISLYEAGAQARFQQVDTRAKRVADGSDFFAINPLGMVPAVRIDEGELLTENPAVLQYVADQHPNSGLAPAQGLSRYRLQQWLSFIGTELHKVVFTPLLDPRANDGAKSYARDQAPARLAHLNAWLDGREFLLDGFTIADAYLTTVLNWSVPTGIDLKRWPAVLAYHRRMHARPSVAKAFAEERALYEQQEARRAQAANPVSA